MWTIHTIVCIKISLSPQTCDCQRVWCQFVLDYIGKDAGISVKSPAFAKSMSDLTLTTGTYNLDSLISKDIMQFPIKCAHLRNKQYKYV